MPLLEALDCLPKILESIHSRLISAFTSFGLASLLLLIACPAYVLSPKFNRNPFGYGPCVFGSTGVTNLHLSIVVSICTAGNLMPHTTSTTIPAHQHIILMRLRLGCAVLAVSSGRCLSGHNSSLPKVIYHTPL